MRLILFSNNNRERLQSCIKKRCRAVSVPQVLYRLELGMIRNNKIEDLPGEEWRPIEGYDGKYLESSMGRI